MDPDFVVQVKCTIFGLNRGLRVYVDMYALDFYKKKSTSKYLFCTDQTEVSDVRYYGLKMKSPPSFLRNTG